MDVPGAAPFRRPGTLVLGGVGAGTGGSENTTDRSSASSSSSSFVLAPAEGDDAEFMTLSMLVTVDSAMFHFALDKFVTQPLAEHATLFGLRVHSQRSTLAPQAMDRAVLTLRYPRQLATPGCPWVPMTVPLVWSSPYTAQAFASDLQQWANTVLAPLALAALAEYGSPTGVPAASMVFTGASWAPTCVDD